MKLFKNQIMIKNILVVLMTTLCLFGNIFTMSFTTSYTIQKVANELNDYYKNNNISKEKAPVVRINCSDDSVCSKIFQNYYYTGSHTKYFSFRYFYNSNTSFLLSNDIVINSCINTQNTFSISDQLDDGTYYVDYGLFSSIYSQNFLPNKQYLSPRFECDGFIYISDKMADEMIKSYNEPNITYDDLILREKYSKVELLIDGEKTSKTFSINSVLSSSSRNGKRVDQLYGNFCLLYGANRYMINIQKTIEIDLKNDIFSFTKLYDGLCVLGCSKDNTTISTFVYDLSLNKYVSKTNVDKSINDLKFKNDSFWPYMINAVLFLAFFYILLFSFKLKTVQKGIFVSTGLLIIYFLLCYLIYFPPVLNIFPIIYLITFLVIIFSKIIALNNKKDKDLLCFDEITI